MMNPLGLLLLILGLAIVTVLAATWLLRPALARMGIGYAVHRKKQAALITAGLMVATTVIAAAGIAADSSGRSFTESLLGQLELTDVILDATHRGGGLTAGEMDRFANDPRLPRPDAMALTLRRDMSFDDIESGRGDDRVAIWGVDPGSFGAIGSLDALSGSVPVSLASWSPGQAVVNEAAAREFGILVGDGARIYSAGEEVFAPVDEVFEGHLELATWGELPTGEAVPAHHPDDNYRFTYNTTHQVVRDLSFSLRSAEPDVEFVLTVTDTGNNVYRAGPATAPVNVTVPAEMTGYPQWQIQVDSPLASDVDFSVTATEVRRVILPDQELPLVVAAIVEQPGSDPLANGPVVFVSLTELQAFLQQPGSLNVALVDYPDSVDLRGLDDTFGQVNDDVFGGGVAVRNDRANLERQRAQIEDAVRFTFLGIGSFSIMAGFMLIGVMMALLVEERKRILATSRAIGAQRRELTLAHAHEGSVYSVLAGLAGLVGAFIVAAGLMGPLQTIFQAEGGQFVLILRPSTALAAVGSGFVLTMVAIILSAHSASRFHIAAALKGEDREERGARRWGLAVGLLLAGTGALITVSGVTGSAWAAVLGPCLLGVGLAGVVSRFAGRTRTYAATGLLLSVYLLGSYWFLEVSDDNAEFLLFPLRGVLASISLGVFVAHSTWLHGAFVWLGNRLGRPGAYLEAAFGHLRQRPGRAALTISMFATVLVILTALGTLFSTFEPNDLGDTGGYSVLADTPVALGDPQQFLDDRPPASGADPFPLTQRWVATPWMDGGARNLQRVLQDEEGSRITTSPYVPFAGDEAEAAVAATPEFVQQVRFQSGAFSDGRDLESALTTVRSNAAFVILSDQLVLYDSVQERDVTIRLGDTFEVGRRSDEPTTVTVIGLVHDSRGVGAIVHPDILQEMALARGFDEPGTRIWAEPGSGVTDRELVESFESAFRRAGMVAVAASDVDPDEAAVGGAFQTMISLFLGLGIVIGMVSLALIMGRNVLIRRAEIGTLRALGAPPGGILAMFSVEALFISLASIGIGLGVGLTLAWATVRSDAIFVPLRIDWGALAFLYTVTLLAAVAAAFVPAWQASRVPPAQAVRYTE